MPTLRQASVAPALAASALLVAALVATGCSSGDSGPSLTCPAGQTVCGSMCVDLQTSEATCGSCTNACPSGATCEAGSCRCPAGQPETCGTSPGQCVDLQGDPLHCGDCFTRCGDGTCGSGTCACNPGATPCGDPLGVRCANLANDTSNCGACGHACATNERCQDEDLDGLGTCTCVAPDFKACASATGPVCRDVRSDEANCGDCNVACGSTFTCVAGVCSCSGATPDPCPPASPSLCTNLATDRENCHGCGNRCPVGGSCGASGCQCPTGSKACGPAPGTCVNTSNDVANCGDCGVTCPTGGVCASGTCTCGAGAVQCGAGCHPGTGCCGPGGAEPQFAHQNGLGQTFYDCDPDRSFTAASAQLAARTWDALGRDVSLTASASCGLNCFGWQTAHNCGVWCYAGSLHVGQVFVSGSLVCACGAPTSTWH